MELEYFVPPDEAEKWFEYWCRERLQWYVELGIRADMLRLRPHDPEELSHYSAGTSDVEFAFPWGWGELEGIANRTDFDLKAHSEASGVRARVLRPGDRRALRAVRDRAGGGRHPGHDGVPARRLRRRRGRRRARTVLRLHPRLAPYQVAVLPLSKKETLIPTAREVLGLLQPLGHVRLRRDPVHRSPLPPPGRDRHAAVRHRRLRHARGPGRDHPGRDTTEQVRVPIESPLVRARCTAAWTASDRST